MCVVSQQPPPPPPRVDFALSRSIGVRPLFAGQLASSPSGRDRNERERETVGYAKKKMGERERENEEREGEPTGRAEKPEGLLLGLGLFCGCVTSDGGHVYNTDERENRNVEN